jgi:hypothetical protein
MGRSRGRRLTLITVGAAALLAAGWYLGSPLIIDRMVDEAFPFHIPSAAEARAMPPASRTAMQADLLEAMPSTEELNELPTRVARRLGAQAIEFAAVVPDQEMAEPLPLGPLLEILRRGRLQDADSVHRGSGTATLYRVPGQGVVVLRLEEFRVTNGPDLHVLLATNASPERRRDLGEYVDLGPLKGNVGDQNYMLPEALDYRPFASLVIYCKPFHVVFATALLESL